MSDALAAALMATQQRRRADPSESSRRYGQALLQQGSSTAPVQSPLEGLARALTGAAGGYFSGEADRYQDSRDKETMGGLADMLSADTPEKREAAQKRLTGADPSIAGPLMAGLISDQRKQQTLAKAGDSFGAAFGMPAPGAAPQGMPAAVPPLPSGQPTGSGFNNNLGNIRATPINWDGKGAPHNGFETFGTPDQGAAAMVKNFGAYVQSNPNITVAQAIQKWAPPNENNTDLYIRQVAEGTGINPGMTMAELRQDPAAFAQFLDAVTRKEKGGLPQGVNADTFMRATTPGGQPQPGGGLPINITPQGSAEADPSGNPMPPPVAQPPSIPDVPRPQPNPQTVQRLRNAIASGAMTPQQAEAALNQEVDRDWSVARERANKEYDLKRGEYEYSRKRADDVTAAGTKRGDEQTKQKFEFENKLRDDFNSAPAVKSYRVVVPMLESAKDAATRPTRAADLNLVYAFAKLMDPDSVVRESETAGVVATGNLGDRLGAYLGQLNGQAMLSPDTRQKLIAELDSRFNSLQSSYAAHEEAYKGIADRNGLNFDNVRIPVRGAKPAGGGSTEVSQDEAKRWAGGGAQTGGATEYDYVNGKLVPRK